MKRTIKILDDGVFYRKRNLGNISSWVVEMFGLKNSKTFKYVIFIEPNKKGNFTFKKGNDFYFIYKKEEKYRVYMGVVCKVQFQKLFFKPIPRKRYNISVKKVRI